MENDQMSIEHMEELELWKKLVEQERAAMQSNNGNERVYLDFTALWKLSRYVSFSICSNPDSTLARKFSFINISSLSGASKRTDSVYGSSLRWRSWASLSTQLKSMTVAM
jgi:hypothetical protein